MLRLPINLLVTSDRGLAAYEARLIDPDADPFDMRQIAWLGRTARPSTSVSALAFRNAREAAPSRATHQYFGLGHNQPELGRASCRERWCQYVYISVVAVSLKKKHTTTHEIR